MEKTTKDILNLTRKLIEKKENWLQDNHEIIREDGTSQRCLVTAIAAAEECQIDPRTGFLIAPVSDSTCDAMELLADLIKDRCPESLLAEIEDHHRAIAPRTRSMREPCLDDETWLFYFNDHDDPDYDTHEAIIEILDEAIAQS